MKTEERVRDFLLEEYDGLASPEEMTGDFALRESLDSVGLLQLVSFLEDEFGVEIAHEELVPENFETLGAVTRLVESKRSTSG